MIHALRRWFEADPTNEVIFLCFIYVWVIVMLAVLIWAGWKK